MEETRIWLLFARDCGYVKVEIYEAPDLKADEIGAKIYKLFENWKRFKKSLKDNLRIVLNTPGH